MKKLLLFLLLSIIFTGISFGQAQKKVFAHYMVCFTSYDNGSVAGYKKDIQDAQNLGIDGFALNCGSWDATYKLHVARLFQAANELGTNFSLFLSVDKCCDITADQVKDMVQTYTNNKNYYRYNNRPFLSAWGGGGFFKSIITDLKQKGYNVYFVPFLYNKVGNYQTEIPDYGTIVQNYNTYWKGYIDGYFYFGAVGLPFKNVKGSNLDAAEASATVLHQNKLTFMSFVSPQYWGSSQIAAGRRYYEYNGGEGIISQWESIIKSQKPDWVELSTWNDWGEGTYFSPIDSIETYLYPLRQLHPEKGFYKSHKGFSELSKYYIQWYKSGVKPAINKDKIFYFYRTQSKNANPADPKGMVRSRAGKVDDIIYITSFLRSPATLTVSSGGSVTSYDLAAGITNTRIPFQVGQQIFKVVRRGTTIINQQGEDIISSPKSFNFNVYSGFAVNSK